MKLVVASTGPSLETCVATQLECSRYLLIVDFATLEFVRMLNPLEMLSGPAAGRLLAQELLQVDVSKLLTGKCSSMVSQSLGAAGIQIIAGVTGSVRYAIDEFRHMCMANTCVISHKDLHIKPDNLRCF